MTEISTYTVLDPEDDPKKLREYWDTAIGLQAVDGLRVSAYLESVSNDNINGVYDINHVCGLLEKKYADDKAAGRFDSETHEADIVAARMTKILAGGAFSFSPMSLLSLHQELFNGVLQNGWVGSWRSVNISKPEAVLGGRSARYADFHAIVEQLCYDFNEEKLFKYALPLDKDQVAHLSGFVSNIWQTHPFREGNTRTTALFLELYLQNMGLDVDNEGFKENSQYFRDALVRNNYASLKEGIDIEPVFLERFFENILGLANHDLSKFDLRCPQLCFNTENVVGIQDYFERIPDDDKSLGSEEPPGRENVGR